MSTSKKKFTMTGVFDNLLDDDEGYDDFSGLEEHFHMEWNMNLNKNDGNAELNIFYNRLESADEAPEATDEEYSIEAEIDIKMFSKNRRIENREVKIELNLEITKMSGVLERKTVHFDEKMKELSDVVLVVGEEKFYVSKLFLSFQSTYFKALLLGNFEESKKSEVILQDIDHWEFQKFLEVLYGGNAIDDDYFVSILRLADMYDAPIARRKCEEFLMEKSKKSLREKLELSMEYNMDNAKEKCLSDIKTIADIRSVVPENLEEMDHSLMATLFKKSLYPLK
ncbi:hypothetical protein GCK72_007390 [Caenorhabditis remanei]|uniref:BTB domain-containing protein n=1 Tax=Caenorhabditis remanei TaxID=31234 RepID=A0A6A5HJZ0_CAERE|nr:hypothetical protein GCK72_007390 [Caenorhabditis remanei]KAF1767431.1 hypothetical protein GCK72_007390 [Caenorhabditis remanei]